MTETAQTKDKEIEQPTPTNITTLPTVRQFAPATDVFSDPAAFEHAQRVAKVFAASTLVPAHLRNNLADCLIAYQIARRLNEEPLTVFQNIYVVNGRPGWMTSYLIARVNRAGIFKGRITWEKKGEGDMLSVTACAVLADSGEIVSAPCDMKMAKAEGWTKNPKYTSMPEHMLRWRSAAMLIRLYAPEVMLGMPVVEELETMPPIKDVTPPISQKMRKTLDDFANGTKTEQPEEADNKEDSASAQESGSASPATGQGASDGSNPPQPRNPADATTSSGAPAAPEKAAAEKKVAETTAIKAEAKSKATAGPKTEAEYVTHANFWIDENEDADALEQHWTSEKIMRNKANVSAEVRETLQNKMATKAMGLRGQK